MTKRIFIAINLLNEIKEQIVDIQQTLKLKGIKLVEKENLHITLAFLGDIAEADLIRLESVMLGLYSNIQSFTISIESMGVFPNLNHPKIIWIDVKSEILDRLGQELLDKLKQEKLNHDYKKFSSHITIGRVKFYTSKNISIINKILSQNHSTKFADLTISSIDIMESQLTPTGPIYKVNNTINLVK